MNPQTITDQTWAALRAEFTLPGLAQVHHRLSELMEDPEPVMRQLVRVFLSGLWRISFEPVVMSFTRTEPDPSERSITAGSGSRRPGAPR